MVDNASLLGYADMRITVTLPLPLDPSSQGINSDKKFRLKISETGKKNSHCINCVTEKRQT